MNLGKIPNAPHLCLPFALLMPPIYHHQAAEKFAAERSFRKSIKIMVKGVVEFD